MFVLKVIIKPWTNNFKENNALKASFVWRVVITLGFWKWRWHSAQTFWRVFIKVINTLSPG